MGPCSTCRLATCLMCLDERQLTLHMLGLKSSPSSLHHANAVQARRPAPHSTMGWATLGRRTSGSNRTMA